jgi:Sulfotransferase domain
MSRPEIIYIVGLQKTGIGSLSTMFSKAGYKRTRTRKHSRMLKRILMERLTGKSPNLDLYFAGDTLFADWPAPFLYREAYERFGDRARYILSMRSSPEKWLDSLKTHSLTFSAGQSKHQLIYGSKYPDGREKEHIDYYNNHIKEVRKFFSEKHANHLLCETCIEDEASVQKMLEKLELGDADLSREHRNTGKARLEKFSTRKVYNSLMIRMINSFRVNL